MTVNCSSILEDNLKRCLPKGAISGWKYSKPNYRSHQVEFTLNNAAVQGTNLTSAQDPDKRFIRDRIRGVIGKIFPRTVDFSLEVQENDDIRHIKFSVVEKEK